jgi:hypothetical protein
VVACGAIARQPWVPAKLRLEDYRYSITADKTVNYWCRLGEPFLGWFRAFLVPVLSSGISLEISGLTARETNPCRLALT